MERTYTAHHYKGQFNLLLEERKLIIETLIQTKGSISEASTILNLEYEALRSKVKRHGLGEHRRAIEGRSTNKEVILQVELVRLNLAHRKQQKIA